MGGIRLAAQQKKADLGPSHIHNLTVSRSCCRTPGCCQRGGQQLLRPKTPYILKGVCMPVSCTAQRTHFGCGYFMVRRLTVSPVSSSTTIGLVSLGSGGSGVLEGCQCSLTQPGWSVPQDCLLFHPKTGTFSVSALEESNLFPPTLLPLTACFHIFDCGLWKLSCCPAPVRQGRAFAPAHGGRTVSQGDEKPCLREASCRAKTELKSKPRFDQPSHHVPLAHDLSWSLGSCYLHCPSNWGKHIHEGKECSWLLAMACAIDLGLPQAEEGALQRRDAMFPLP